MLHKSMLKPLALAAMLLTSSSALALGHGYQKTADGVIVTPKSGPAKQVRLQVYGDEIIRVTATPGALSDVAKSLMVNAKPQSHGFTVAVVHGALELKTPKVTADVSFQTGEVTFKDAAGKLLLTENGRRPFRAETIDGQPFYAITQDFNPSTDEAFYGLGQHQNGQMNYNGEDVELEQYNRDIVVPFVVSSKAYGVLWDNNSISRFGDPTPYGLASRDLKLFDAKGQPGGLTASYYVKDQLKVQRVEPDIDYRYLKDLPNWPKEVGGWEGKDQKIVWEGSIESDKPGVHKLAIYSSCYVKVYVDDKLVIDRWRQNWNPHTHNFELPMTPGKPAKIRVEWIPDSGFIALLHNNPLPAAERHSLELTSEVAKSIDYYFVGGANIDQVISGYRHLTGKAVMMPEWAYGFWQSRQRYETAEQLEGVVKEYRKRGLPLDNIVMDWRYWRDPEWGSHKFDLSRFPDPKGMIDQLHSEHAHFMISIWPKFYPTTDNFKELDAKGYIYHRNLEQHGKDWIGYEQTFYDPYAKEARDIYWRQVKENLKVLGVDAWWMDASEPDILSNLDIPERTLRMGPTQIGPAAEYFNSFSLLHSQGVYEGEHQLNPNKRSFILTRSGFAGLQRNGAAVWSGDVAARWEDLKDQISAGVNISMSGLPNWTHDIGGFSVEDRYTRQDPAHVEEWRELNLRWFQFGAFSPLFRSHGEFPYREIYNIAPEGSEVYNSLAWYDQLRYRLMPYIYTLAGDIYQKDGEIMRGLVMDFPGDKKAQNINDEYLFGPDLLVAPVTQFKARNRDVYLPSGAKWYDYATGKLFDGGQTITADAPLSRMPLFVKAGAILPTGPVEQYVGEKRDAPLTVVVYTGADGAFSLYEDDGLSESYAKGAFSRIPMTYNDKTGTLTLGARTGAFDGMLKSRTIKVRFVKPGVASTDFDTVDATVAYTGKALTVTAKP